MEITTNSKYNLNFRAYIYLLKPKETILLTYIGICSAFIGGIGDAGVGRIFILLLALIFGTAGCNGLTNYLDRKIDALMPRTRNRVLPSKMIYPAEKSLLLIIPLLIIALMLSYVLNPRCFIIGLIGITASSLFRKTITCIPFGIIAGLSPILIGWFAGNTGFTLLIIFICIIVALWIPIHVWSVILARKNEYINAGLSYFPIKSSDKNIVIYIFTLIVLLSVAAASMYIFNIFRTIYMAIMLPIISILVISGILLIFKSNSKYAWFLYKISSFPFLGLFFTSMLIEKVVL